MGAPPTADRRRRPTLADAHPDAIVLVAMVYLHPLLGIFAVGLIGWVATQGFRARHRKAYAPEARRAHARWAPVAWALVTIGAVAGTALTAWARPDMDVAASWHFRAGWGLAAGMTAAAVLSKLLPRKPWARTLHPIVGLACLVGAPLIAAFGFKLLP